MQSNVFSTNKTLNAKGQLIDFFVPKIMGILNVTPDSFYDGGKFESVDLALKRCEQLILEGADMIDLGGYSTRPGAADVSVAEELDRVIPILKRLVQSFPKTLFSIDTFRSGVATAAVHEGASIINDVSGGNADPRMFQVVASLKVPYILMHSRGTPKTMATLVHYDNLVRDVALELSKKVSELKSLGVSDIIIDPGFGFAKTIDQNFQLLQALGYLQILEKPLMVGLSRKSMIWKTLETRPEEALNGTTVLNTIALMNGANILRVHDVKEAREAVKLVQKINGSRAFAGEFINFNQ
jgi:dihydropteroate synthase